LQDVAKGRTRDARAALSERKTRRAKA